LARVDWRLTGRLDAITFPQVCSTIIPATCSHPGDLAIGSIVGLSLVNAWFRRVTARATAGAVACRWSDGTIDLAFELHAGIEVLTSLLIGVQLGVVWRCVGPACSCRSWGSRSVSSADCGEHRAASARMLPGPGYGVAQVALPKRPAYACRVASGWVRPERPVAS